MATVKTQGGKVVLKDGKVSCTCCEEECCMYPAQALADGLYTVDDLPSELLVRYCSEDTPRTERSETVLRSGTAYTGSDTRIYFSGGVWFVEAYNNLFETDFNCLIGSLKTEDFACGETFVTFAIEDRFADTYTVSGPVSGAVTREGICVWTGTNLRLTNFGYQWKINGNNKSGFQNTPVGSYEEGFTVS